jgi:hypothetical protein
MAIFSGHCRETGELGLVAGLTVMSCSLKEPDLRMKFLSAGGTAFAASIAFVGFLLRAVMESRSRSSTGLPETLTCEIFRGAIAGRLVPRSHPHEVAAGLPTFRDVPGPLGLAGAADLPELVLEGFPPEHMAASVSISPLSAPEPMILE